MQWSDVSEVTRKQTDLVMPRWNALINSHVWYIVPFAMATIMKPKSP